MQDSIMPGLKVPKLTIALSLIIIIAYLLLSSMFVFANKGNMEEFGFSINKIANIINYNFVHSSYAHLFANLAIIVASGIVVESALRKRDFLALFFGGAAFSAIVFCAISPQYSLAGASAGAVSLLGAAIVVDPKKTAAYAAISLVAGYLIISGISFYAWSTQKKIAEEVIVLEQAKKEAVHLGNNAEAQKISVQIAEKEKISGKIQEGENLKLEIPPNFEIHLIAALFGALYVLIFRRSLVEGTALRIHHLLKP